MLLAGLSGNAIVKDWFRGGALSFIATALDAVNNFYAKATFRWDWPGLAGQIIQVAPVTQTPGPYPADQTSFTLNLLSASGSACLMASIASMITLTPFG